MEKAVNIAEKLAKISSKENNVELAQCYCEYALSGELESAVEKRSILQKALNVSPTSVRASMLLADLEMANKTIVKPFTFREYS